MKKILLFVLINFFSVWAHAEVQVQIDPAQVSLGDSFTLTLTQANTTDGGIPDLTVLQQDFAILGTERQMNYSIVNGQAQSASQWVITLKALKPGVITIPALTLGGEQSTPVTIHVAATASAPTDQKAHTGEQQDVVLSASVDEKQPYINQQILYTVTLYNSKRLLDADYQGPQVENALLIPLGDATRYQTVRAGKNYLAEEQRYAIFPQKSGDLKIISPTFTALIYDFDSRRVQVGDKTITVHVKPAPKAATGRLWVPAKNITLTEHYENGQQKISQGSTLTRTVVIEGVGLPAQLLPKLDFKDSDGVRVYPEKGEEHNQVRQGDLVGRITFKVTYLFDTPGTVSIPELRVPWFNTATNRNEVAVLAPRRMEVGAATTTTPQASNTLSQSQNQSKAAAGTARAEDSSWPWILAGIFAFAWCATLGLWAWQRQRGRSTHQLYKEVMQNLETACMQGNPHKARDALVQWAVLYWPHTQVLNLTQMAGLLHDASLKKEVLLLSQVLYKRNEHTQWRGDALLKAITSLKRVRPGARRRKNKLPPIHP